MSYSNKVLQHFENPSRVGAFDEKDPNVGTGLVGAPACGDVIKLQLMFDAQGRIVDVRFKSFGCGSAIASASYASTWLPGRTLQEALNLKNTDIAQELALPPVKTHCSVLAEDAIRQAIADYQRKQEELRTPRLRVS